MLIYEELTHEIRGAATEVHRYVSPGKLRRGASRHGRRRIT